MRPGNPGRALGILLSAAFFIAAGGQAVAQMRGSAAGGRTNWAPPFAPASSSLLTGVQRFMSTPTGASLVSQIPSFRAVSVYSPESDLDLRAMGALGAQLPAGFEARLTVALRQPGEGSDELAALSKELENAYQAAIPEVTKAVQARAQQVALGVAYGQIEGAELGAAAAELERFGVYGPSVQEKASIVRHLASQATMGHAQSIAGDFLRRTRSSDEVAAGASLPGSQRRMPDEWVLHAYKQAAAAKPSDQGDSAKPKEPPPPKPEGSDPQEKAGAKPGDRKDSAKPKEEPPKPKAERQDFREWIGAKSNDRGATVKPQAPPAPPALQPRPDARNFYERIGAAKDMSADEIKAAYRKAVMLYHPDKHSNEGAAVIKKMTKDFQNIQEAYAALSDPKKRAAYDITLAKTSPAQAKASDWRPWTWTDFGAAKR
ncbi:MAG: J domain-containing protein [Elusimicrobia bacterium]|nr:J domain-containing protein [Elusimicrobiota bacterium]